MYLTVYVCLFVGLISCTCGEMRKFADYSNFWDYEEMRKFADYSDFSDYEEMRKIADYTDLSHYDYEEMREVADNFDLSDYDYEANKDGRPYGDAQDEMYHLCKLLANPGKAYRPDPGVFKEEWDDQLDRVGAILMGENMTRVDMLATARENCTDMLNIADAPCAYLRLRMIGSVVEEDVKRIQEHIDAKYDRDWYIYTVYLSSWFLDEVMLNLNCGAVDTPSRILITQWEYILALTLKYSEDRSTQQCLISAYRMDLSRGLRHQVDIDCYHDNTKPICQLSIMFAVVDSVTHFLDNIGNGDTAVADLKTSEIYTSAMKLHFYTLKYVSPADCQASFARSVTDVNDVVFKTIQFFSQRIQINDMAVVHTTLKILPPATALKCNRNERYPTFAWALCTFCDVMDQLRAYTYTVDSDVAYSNVTTSATNSTGANTKRKMKIINSDINYVEFLKNKQVQHIMDLVEGIGADIHATADAVKQNTAEWFGKLGDYFKTVADFDGRKSKADRSYIRGKLKTLSREHAETMELIKTHLIPAIEVAMFTSATSDVAAAVGKMIIHMAKAANPFKWLFDSGNADEIIEAGEEISQKTALVAKAISHAAALDPLYQQSRNVHTNYGKNKEMIKVMGDLISEIDSLTTSETFDKAKDTFLSKYNDYSPQVTAADITELNARWVNMVDEACATLDAGTGFVSGITKTVVYSTRTCEKAKLAVAKLQTINQNIHEVQFELVDALASVMRAHTQEQAANKIVAAVSNNAEAEQTVADLRTLGAFAFISYRISTLAAVEMLCDELEYRQGRRPDTCRGFGTDIPTLTALKVPQCSTLRHFVEIPTHPSSADDLAYIDMARLYAGEVVEFKIPDRSWLHRHGWLPIDSDRHSPIYVKSFELYLPVVSSYSKMVRVTVGQGGGNILDPPHGTQYVLTPARPLHFVYTEGGRRSACRQPTIPNIYSICNDRMPPICPSTTAGDFEDDMDAPLYPSIYCTFQIQVSGYQSSNLSTPATELPIYAVPQLCQLLPESRKTRRHLRQPHSQRKGRHMRTHRNKRPTDRRRSVAACCADNTYFQHYFTHSADGHLRRSCHPCPEGTQSQYGGLFCGNTTRWMEHANAPGGVFTYDTAKEACVGVGAQIAARHLVVPERYDGCTCGWVQEGETTSHVAGCKQNITCDSGVFCTTLY